MVGAEVLVQGAIAGGQALGVREAVIGMTVVALGACAAAARKRQTDIIVGGLVGSALFNILSIVAITAMLKPLVVAPEFAGLDLIAVIAVTGLVASGLFLLRSFAR
jgi:cation:H+ antiporter